MRGPYERVAGQDSVSIVYDPLVSGTFPKKALTTNRAVHPDTGAVHTTLKVARFVDGLGREIQSQAETDIAVQGPDGLSAKHGRAISGRIAFDAAGRTAMISQPTFAEGIAFAFEKIGWDRNNCTTTGPVYSTHNEYDALDRVTKVTAPGGVATTNTRKIASHPRVAARSVLQTEVVDAVGKVRRLFHDASDRLVGVVEVLSGRELKTTYDYSAAGDLTAVQDARGNVRTFEYDLAGRRTAIVTPDTGRKEMGYDAMGNVERLTDSEMCPAAAPLLSSPACATKIIQRRYAKNRLTSIDYPSLTGTQDVAFTYGDDDPTNLCSETVAGVVRPLSNTEGRVCWLRDLAGSEKRSFGALGEMRLQERALPLFEGSGLSRTYVTRFRHDSFGRLLWLEYPDGEKLNYGYDGGGRVTSVAGVRGSESASYVLKRLYDVHGKPIVTTFANGVTEQGEYEPDTQRVKRRVQYRGSVLILDLQISEYDKANNIKTSVTQRNEGHEIARLERAYSYDDLHRLDTFTVNGKRADGASGLTLSGNYDFDDVGNIAHQTMTGSGLAVATARDWTYAYPAGATRPNLPNVIGPQAFTYDDRGALETITSGTTQTSIEWNDEGQLIGVSAAASSVSRYLYGADAARAWKQVRDAASTEVLHYPNPYYTADYRRTRPGGCADDSCATTVPSRTKQIRIDGTTVASVVGVLASDAGGSDVGLSYVSTAQSFLHADQVRSTIATTGPSGGAERVYEYLPFGELLTAASSQEILSEPSYASFNGMERDSDFDYFGARHYSPALGRWLSPDPVALNVQRDGEARANLYAFADNNPLKFWDPDGKEPVEALFKTRSRYVDQLYRFSAEKGYLMNDMRALLSERMRIAEARLAGIEEAKSDYVIGAVGLPLSVVTGGSVGVALGVLGVAADEAIGPDGGTARDYGSAGLAALDAGLTKGGLETAAKVSSRGSVALGAVSMVETLMTATEPTQYERVLEKRSEEKMRRLQTVQATIDAYQEQLDKIDWEIERAQ